MAKPSKYYYVVNSPTPEFSSRLFHRVYNYFERSYPDGDPLTLEQIAAVPESEWKNLLHMGNGSIAELKTCLAKAGLAMAGSIPPQVPVREDYWRDPMGF